MAQLNRIGNKLGIVGVLGILLAGGMVANQQVTSSSVIAGNQHVAKQQDISENEVLTENGTRRMQLALRDLRLSRTSAEVEKAFEFLRVARAFAEKHLDAALALVTRAENRDRLVRVRQLLNEYASAGEELAKLQGEYFSLIGKRNQYAAEWRGGMEKLLASPALIDAANRAELESKIRLADGIFQDIRASTWRFSAMGEPAMKQQILTESTALSDAIVQSRGIATGKAMVEAIEKLYTSEKNYLAITDETFKLESTRADFVQQRTGPLAEQIIALIESTVSASHALAAEARKKAAEDIGSASQINLGFGAVVILVLLGSVLFSFLGIARPLTRLNSAMEKMAAGQTDIDIPGVARGDEIGDMAKTITVIRQNAEREAMAKQEASQREETKRAAQRKADMMKLAGDFEGAVGEIIHTVSSAATELEASANKLTSTAARTEHLSTVVAAAAEEASTNVQSVASASEEMSSSVNEISRQVQESARIAGDAVSQAEKTNVRVTELSEAAKKIGDVVKLISTIAEQTNLLALNATIEAARAGEAGRGFAVVASEVKALAEQTSKATGEIGQQIAAIQTATEGSVVAIREIGLTIGRISEISSTIAAAVEEQGAATQEISRNVQQASQGTTDVAANISDVQRGSSETGSASSQVLSSAQSLSVESNRLKAEVQNFLATVRAA